MDYVFINSDVYLQTSIDFSKIEFEATTIVVPQLVMDEIQKSENEEKKNSLFMFFNEGHHVTYVGDNDSEEITDYMEKFNCEDDNKYLVTFSTDLLSKNKYRNLLDNSEFARRMESLSINLYKIFVDKLKKRITINADDSKSRYYLSECYLNGRGVDKNIDEWKNELKISAKQGFDIAQIKLAVVYNNNNNFQKAKELYEQAANKGNSLAMYYLGCLLLKGANGVEPNTDKAVHLISQAAEKDMILAKAILGCLYYEGKYIKRDLQKAKSLLELTAQKGIVEAQNALGSMYFNGDEVKQNTETAIVWTTRAAEKGFSEAIFNLGLYYESQKKYNDARAWYEKSAQENNSKANYKLGELYELRKLADDNPIGKATQYFQTAAKLGNEQAKMRLDAINRNQYIEDAFKELNINRIKEEHNRAKHWYTVSWSACIGFLLFLITFIIVNICSTPDSNEPIQIVFKVLATCTSLSLLFISINQAARMRKSMILLSKEIQEYEYIKGLLKAQNILSINSLETNKEISTTISKMIEIHLNIQKERIGKEDHTDVKDITPEILNFFKDNTSTILSNYNNLYQAMANTLKGDKTKE